MTRIQPAAAHAALDQAARRITDAAGDDAKVSKAELKAAVATLSGTEKKLVDLFARFATRRAGTPAEGLSERDVQEAVAYAKASLISKYDLDGDGLSPDEVKRMAKTGQLAVQLAAELAVSGSVDAPALTDGGESWYELRERVTIDSRVTLTDPAGLELTLAQQLIAATHQSTYTDVKSLADAFAAVDGGEFVVTSFTDPASGKAYVGIDYGAGDSTYGAIFEAGSETVAFGIHDGSVEAPVTHAPKPPDKRPMAAGQSWLELKGRSEIVTTEALTDVKGIEPLLGQQLVSAAQQAGLQVGTPAEALAAIDAGGFTITRFNDPAKRDQYLGITFGEGERTFGGIFRTYSSDATFGIHGGALASPLPTVGKPITAGDETFGDVLDRVEMRSQRTVTKASEIGDALLGEQLLAAAAFGLQDPPQTLQQAFRAIDSGGFEVREFVDPATQQAYVSVDFGVGGGNTFGAVFERGTSRVAIAIIDGLMEA